MWPLAPRRAILLRDLAGPGTESSHSGVRHGCSACGWDAFVESCPGDNLVQTEAWARTKRLLGFDTRNIVLREQGAIVGGAQLVIEPQGEFGAIGYVARGPLLARADYELAIRLLDEIEAHARAARIWQLTIQPPEGSTVVDAALRARGYGTASTAPAPMATLRLDLERCPDRARAELARAGRDSRGADLALRLGDRDDVGVFHELHRLTALRHQHAPLSPEVLLKTWDVLAPAGYLNLVLAYADERPVAGLWVSTFAGHVTTRLAGWRDRHTQRRTAKACDWWIINWARRHGHCFYDVGGIERPVAALLRAGKSWPETASSAAIAQMRKLGATPVLFPLARATTFALAIRPAAMLHRPAAAWPEKRAAVP